jgi:hypothetical protein
MRRAAPLERHQTRGTILVPRPDQTFELTHPDPEAFRALLLAQSMLGGKPNHMRTIPLLNTHQQKPLGHAPLPPERARKGDILTLR